MIVQELEGKTRIESDRKVNVTVDGIEYEINAMQFDNVNHFATVMIYDKTHEESYVSYGCIDLNGHTFYSRWDVTFDYETVRVVTGRRLIIEIY